MVYSVSPRLKLQVKLYVVLELVENAMGYLVVLVLSVAVGAFGQFMSRKTLWPCVALTVLEAVSKLLRGFIHKVYFRGMSCRQVAIGQGKSYRFKLGTYQVLGGKFISTFAYVALIAVIRLLSMILQVVLTWYLYKHVPVIKTHPEYHTDWGVQRLEEFLYATCLCLIVHSGMVFLLIYFSLLSCLLMQCIRLFAWCCGCARSAASASIQSRNIGGPFLERLDRFQREMETGITWYVHRHRHFEFGANEAQAHEDKCGLPGYWFYSVKELLGVVGSHLPYLKDEHRRWDERRKEIKTGRKLTMALESLFELSRACKACDTCNLFVSNEMACYMQDLPQTSRCRHDMDAGRDFAQAEGYLAMLQVLQCCPRDSVDAELAALILSGFAAGLSVLPWQPDRDHSDTDFIVHMLGDDDFRYCTKHSLYVLLDLLEPYASGNADPRSDEKLRVQEAAASAICAFARAASDIHALVNCPVGRHLRSQHSGDDDPAMKGYVSMLSYGFTTICPVGWPLDMPWPSGLVDVDEVWVTTVKEFLSDQRTLSTLLNCVQREASSSIAADCIRTLSWLWTRRVMYWHRHDLRMKPARAAPAAAECQHDLPPALFRMHGESRGVNLQVLRRLITLCLDKPESFSAFSQLHLAKIFISQELREADTDVAKLLLECLKYWRRALGTRELDWFAIETVEAMRDLLHVASDDSKREVKLTICKSPGGVDCVRIMLNGHVSRIRAVRFYTCMGDFDRSLVYFLSENRMNCWSMEANDHAMPCSGAAAGLLADLLKVGDMPLPPMDPLLGAQPRGIDLDLPGHDDITMVLARQPKPRPRLDRIPTRPCRNARGQDAARVPVQSVLPSDPGPNPYFFISLFKSLVYNLLVAVQQNRQRSSAPGQDRGFLVRMKNHWRTFGARMVLIFCESLGNPAWVPAISLFEDLEAACTIDERMEVLAQGLNSLLATRNAIRVIKLVVDAYPENALDARLVTALIPSMVNLLTTSPARLHKRLHLVALENRCNHEIRNGIVAVLQDVVGRISELGGRDPDPDELKNNPALPTIAKLQDAERTWRDWCGNNGENPIRPQPPNLPAGGAAHNPQAVIELVPVDQLGRDARTDAEPQAGAQPVGESRVHPTPPSEP